ncbi:hypothetical protein [Desulfosediminicola flagellatus]|uniref:hypothetical protein n=1 Tax=Desulfosediminicola flagellatus TaxID=2569541 RepID=UPI0010ABEEF2|nr:hypothetical protein [Desulfosediminicola flagellatus]
MTNVMNISLDEFRLPFVQTMTLVEGRRWAGHKPVRGDGVHLQNLGRELVRLEVHGSVEISSLEVVERLEEAQRERKILLFSSPVTLELPLRVFIEGLAVQQSKELPGSYQYLLKLCEFRIQADPAKEDEGGFFPPFSVLELQDVNNPLDLARRQVAGIIDDLTQGVDIFDPIRPWLTVFQEIEDGLGRIDR